jgi:hypothetical protein
MLDSLQERGLNYVRNLKVKKKEIPREFMLQESTK